MHLKGHGASATPPDKKTRCGLIDKLPEVAKKFGRNSTSNNMDLERIYNDYKSKIQYH